MVFVSRIIARPARISLCKALALSAGLWSNDPMHGKTLDHFDLALLRALQQDSSLSQRDLAERIGLSQNACWRRLSALAKSSG